MMLINRECKNSIGPRVIRPDPARLGILILSTGAAALRAAKAYIYILYYTRAGEVQQQRSGDHDLKIGLEVGKGEAQGGEQTLRRLA